MSVKDLGTHYTFKDTYRSKQRILIFSSDYQNRLHLD